jgi:hypothetical protein
MEGPRVVTLSLAIIFGGLAVIFYSMAWHARRQLRATLKSPRTEEAEEATHRWEGRAILGHNIGLAASSSHFSALSPGSLIGRLSVIPRSTCHVTSRWIFRTPYAI